MDLSDKKVAILVDNYFEQSEFEEPVKALRRAGAKVVVVSAKDKVLTGMRHVKTGGKFNADLLLKDADMNEYDALVLPGGAINADSLRMVDKAKEWVNHFMESGKTIAAICHAPWVLISASAVYDRKLTSYRSIQDDIENAGGEWLDEPVVVDGNLITSRQPSDLPQFNYAIINMLYQQHGDDQSDDEGGDSDYKDDEDAYLTSDEIDKHQYIRSAFVDDQGDADDDEEDSMNIAKYDRSYLKAFVKMQDYKLRIKILEARANRLNSKLLRGKQVYDLGLR